MKKKLLIFGNGIAVPLKLLSFLVLFFCLTKTSHAQSFLMDACNRTAGTTYGIYSTSTANANSRNAVIYPASQLATVAGETLEAIYFERSSTTGSLSGPANIKIYLKEVVESDWGAGSLDWATAITGATLVLDTDPGTIFGTDAGWKKFSFTNNFAYAGTENLAMFIEYIGPAASSSSISWYYQHSAPCINTGNSNTTKYNNNTSGTPAALLATSNYRRLHTGFDIVLSCGYPFDAAASNINSSSADISWTAPSTAPANGYEYYISTNATEPVSSTTPSGNTGAGVTNITGLPLTSGTANYFWVRSNCGITEKSPWSSVLALYPIPDNDECENAIMLTQSPTCTNEFGYTASATASINPNPCTGTADDDVWFSFEATQPDALVTLSGLTNLEGSGTTTYFQVYSGDCNNLSNIACYTSSTGIVGNLNPGEIYYIRVFTSTATARVSFSICVTELAAAPTTCPSFTSPATGGTVSELPLLDWAVSTNASGYNIYLDGNNPPGNLYATVNNNNESSYQITTPLAAGTYYWYVESFNSLGAATCTATPRSFIVIAAPANDEATGAIGLVVNADETCTAILAGTTSGATQSLDEDPTCTPAGMNDDVWYSFTATSSYHVFTLSSVSSASAISLYQGTVGNLVFITGGCTSASTTVDLYQHGLTPGTIYYIRIYTTATLVTTIANFNICIKTPPLPPANDEAVNAIAVTVNNSGFTCTSPVSGTTQSASPSIDEAATCSATGDEDDVWYKFTASSTSHFLTVTGASSTTALAVYSGVPGSLTFMTGNCASTNLIASGLTPAVEYYLRVYSTSTTATVYSDFTLCISTPPPPPANDEAVNAIAVTVNNTDLTCTSPVLGTTQSATASSEAASSCSPTGVDDDVWYKFTASSTTHFLTVTGASSTTALAVYSGVPGSLVFMTGNCASTNLTATGLTASQEYYLRLYSTSTSTTTFSEFTLCIGTPPPPPANDEIGAAILLTASASESCATPTSGTTSFATQTAGIANPSCSATGINDDVWFSFEAISTGHSVIISNETSTIAVAVYEEATPGVYTQITGACASSTITVSGLTIGTTYYIRAYTTSTVDTYSDFSICVGSTPTSAPVNNEASGAVALTVGAGCTQPIYTNTLATQSATEVYPSCVGTAGFGTVWFSFVAPASGFVKISNDYNVGSMGTDSRMAVYSTTDVNDYTTFVSLGCDDDNGSAITTRSVIYQNNLVAGNTYYIQVSGHLTSTLKGTFCITVDEFNASMLSGGLASCTTGQSLSSYSNSYIGSLSLTDLDGNLRTMLRRNTAGVSTSTYAGSLTINTGAVRQDGRAAYYLDRNILITNSTATDVNVKFFFTDAELAALTAADPTITLASLGITKQSGTTCTSDFTDATGTGTKLPALSTGSANGVHWIEVNTPNFSNFFVNKADVLLPVHLEFFNAAKQTNSKNLLSWKLNCANTNGNTVVLQRSADQTSFADIFTKINSTEALCNQAFSFVDNHVLPGMNYYRLKMLNADGSITYSAIVALYNSSKLFDIVQLAPNPVRGLATVTIASTKAGSMKLMVMDITGKMIMTQQISLSAGENRINLQTAKLAAGTYYIYGKTNESVTKTISFVKQ